MTDMVKNGHSIGPRVVRSDPWVVRDANSRCWHGLRGPFQLDDKINNKLLLLLLDKKCNFKVTIIIIIINKYYSYFN